MPAMSPFQKVVSAILAGIVPFSPGFRLIAATGAPAKPAALASRPALAPAEPAITVNETVPKVESPKAGLEFSAQPTAEEIFRARLFEEPMVLVGGTPSAGENAALATAMIGYAKRSGPDDFASLLDFLQKYPKSPWRAALLVNLGLEAYRTAHYTACLEHWAEAWKLAKDATDAPARAVADRAVGELAGFYARLGRMPELSALLSAVQGRVFSGPAGEQISRARAGLWAMQNEPGVSFRCGPLALLQIQLAQDPAHARVDLVHRSKSPQTGFALPEVAALSREMGMPCRMAFRVPGAAIAVPSVIHWKVGHYAAIVRQEGERYLIQDPTFRNDVWATQAALDAEASGYFLVPEAAPLASGWRSVEDKEGAAVFGKGDVGGPDGGGGGGGPAPPPPCPGDGPRGMAVPSVDLLFVSLGLADEPLGYQPPVGPAVRFSVHYNHREAAQPASFSYSNLGPKWTFDWLSYIQDDPTNLSANVTYYRMGGFIRYFTGFDAATQSYALQPYDLTRLVRTSATSYELQSADGSKAVFSQSDGSAGSLRRVFLKQFMDAAGNAVTLTYDASLRVVAITDAIGQVTTLTYGRAGDIYKVTKVTDPFGRFATFDYDSAGRLSKITDVVGLVSQFIYEGAGDFISALVTPYGTTAFTRGESGTTRWLETLYPDGSRERTEFNQTADTGVAGSVPAATVPAGVSTRNEFLNFRNTFFWSKAATAAGYGDYSKARVYHWTHTPDYASAARTLESTKAPLENRVWFDYSGQIQPIVVGSTNQPTHVARVLDDGSTQLYTYEYNALGRLTRVTDPLGRAFAYVYAANGLDLLETRMTRAGASELIYQATYNSRRLPLTRTDAAGQTTTFTYNSRGQPLTITDPKGQTTTLRYNTKGYLTAVDGPLAGSADSVAFTYDGFGRLQTVTDSDGYALTLGYDALDRLTRITHPDGSSEQYIYQNLDIVTFRDRAGRETAFTYNAVRQMTSKTDPLNRTTAYQWCRCGDLKSLTDPLGRVTTWEHDVQGRVTSKTDAGGACTTYAYERTTSRRLQVIDPDGQTTRYEYLRDNALAAIRYVNAAIATPDVSFTYDPDYLRLATMTDGTGTTLYRYHPITDAGNPGAGRIAAIDGPLASDTITCEYDELGRCVTTSVNGVPSTISLDAAGRLTGATNALGSFAYTYVGATNRPSSVTYPNGQTTTYGYADNLNDRLCARITHARGASTISEFRQDYDTARRRLSSWSQQSDAAVPVVYALGYDAADQLAAASGVQGGAAVQSFAYGYDLAANRVSEQANGVTRAASFNALNELTAVGSASGPALQSAATYEWDAAHRVVAAVAGNKRTEFTYDGLGRRVAIREKTNGVETAYRRFVWCGGQICEERNAANAIVKRFFRRGVKVEAAGTSPGKYFYTQDHLGSIRELTDESGAIRARYGYEPYGARNKLAGDLEADFGFTGHFYDPSTALCLAQYRAYDPRIGRWLSRDPLPNASLLLGPNLYAYVNNNPANNVDPNGLYAAAAAGPLVIGGGLGLGLLGPIGLGLGIGAAALSWALGSNSPGYTAGPTDLPNGDGDGPAQGPYREPGTLPDEPPLPPVFPPPPGQPWYPRPDNWPPGAPWPPPTNPPPAPGSGGGNGNGGGGGGNGGGGGSAPSPIFCTSS